jgi:hypothetical protein
VQDNRILQPRTSDLRQDVVYVVEELFTGDSFSWLNGGLNGSRRRVLCLIVWYELTYVVNVQKKLIGVLRWQPQEREQMRLIVHDNN